MENKKKLSVNTTEVLMTTWLVGCGLKSWYLGSLKHVKPNSAGFHVQNLLKSSLGAKKHSLTYYINFHYTHGSKTSSFNKDFCTAYV